VSDSTEPTAPVVNLDAEAVTHCTHCKTAFHVMGDMRCSFYDEDRNCREVICLACSTDRQMQEYHQTGELTSRLMSEAISAVNHLDHGDLNRLRHPYGVLYKNNETTYRAIHDFCNKIDDMGRLIEISKWFGRPDLATPSGLAQSRAASREWDTTFTIPLGPGSAKAYYEATDKRGHRCDLADCAVLMWGCAGRLMLTLRDSRDADDPLAKFGGAQVTFIFDDSSKHPRGGIQSLCGTFGEVSRLCQAVLDSPLAFVPDEQVTVA
jgi:hypothetical protein